MLRLIFEDLHQYPALIYAIKGRGIGCQFPLASDDWNAHFTLWKSLVHSTNLLEALSLIERIIIDAHQADARWRLDDKNLWNLYILNLGGVKDGGYVTSIPLHLLKAWISVSDYQISLTSILYSSPAQLPQDSTNGQAIDRIMSDSPHRQLRAFSMARIWKNLEIQQGGTMSPHTTSDSSNALVNAFESHFDQHCYKQICSMDLQQAVVKLSPEDFAKLKTSINRKLDRSFENSHESLVSVIHDHSSLIGFPLLNKLQPELENCLCRAANALSLDFHRISDTKRSACAANDSVGWTQASKSLERLSTSAAELYNIAHSTAKGTLAFNSEGSHQALMLALRSSTMHTVLAQDWRTIARNVLRRACMLVPLSRPGKENSDAKLVQLSLCISSGQLSQAFETFNELGVKEILTDSLSPLLFTGISLRHPLPSAFFSPYSQIGKFLKFYSDNLSNIARYQKIALDWENYAQALEFDKFFLQLQNSLTRQLLRYERRSISRLTLLCNDEDDFKFGRSCSTRNIHLRVNNS